jgi:signal transduction histidine kinase
VTVAPGELRRIGLLRDLSDSRLEELAARGRPLELAPGEYLFREGEQATFLSLLLDGHLETTHAVGGDEVLLLQHEPGGFLGAISLVTGETYRGSTRATEASRLFLLDPDAFRALLVSEPDVFKAVMDVFVPVITNFTAAERDREKLLALGSLAAGLAHELNNPAAAAQRAAAELKTADARAEGALARLASEGIGPEAMGRLCSFTAEALASSAKAASPDALDRADRQAALEAWLEEHGVADGYELAPTLVDAGLDEAWAQRMLTEVAPAEPAEALGWIASRVTAARIARELENATARISHLVQSVREYTYLDQAPRQEIDIHDGLESTLAVLEHKLSDRRTRLVRDYDTSLPRIDVHAAELNQVWTNLLDNAIAAAGDDGTVTVRTYLRGDFLTVEVEDDGPGVPAEIRDRIFDSFFTTKEPGEGTGLGLDIAKRIVVRHRGDLRLADAESGGARFQVLLPVPRLWRA